MDNLHGVLVITYEAPVGGNLCGDRFGFNVINDLPNVPLEGFCFEMCFTERAKGIHTEHNLVPVLVEHKREGIELAVEWTNRIDGTVTRLWLKKGADVEIFVGF